MVLVLSQMNVDSQQQSNKSQGSQIDFNTGMIARQSEQAYNDLRIVSRNSGTGISREGLLAKKLFIRKAFQVIIEF
jgi:hypothetical protein